MNAGVLVKVVEAGAGAPGCKFEIWPWSAAFAAVKVASWAIMLTIGSAAATMFAACRRLVATMVEVGAVNSVRESQRLLLSGRLVEGESIAALVGEWTALRKRVDGGSEGEWTAL